MTLAGSLACTANETTAWPSGEVSHARLIAARADSANWLTYAGAWDAQRFSLLSEIDRTSVVRLAPLWNYPIDTPHPVETTPLVVDGTMYITRPPGIVAALDAATGRLLWEFTWPVQEGLALCCGYVNRGLAMLGHTLYLGTIDAHLVAIDARTGQKRWDVAVGDWREGISITAAPLAFKDLVITGTGLSQAHLTRPTPGEIPKLRGRIDAYDAATGRLRWRFYTVPVHSERFSETWEAGSWWVGGGAAWLTGSYDPSLNLVYWGVGAPNAPAFERFRPGDNLFTSSVVALDADSGTLRWHYQFTPHDSHDWDAAQAMVLADVELGAEVTPLLLTANRNGFFYALDRRDGRFRFARPFAKQTWATGIDSSGRPIIERNIAPTLGGNEVAPPQDGATNWWPPSFSPRTSLFYVTAHDASELFFTADLPRVIDDSARTRVGRAIARRMDFKSVVSSIRALDAATGEIRWEHRLPQRSTPGVLATAGGLVFAGSTAGDFWALDDATGRVLWQGKVDGWIHSAPITYRVGGRQLVTVASSKGLFTFALAR